MTMRFLNWLEAKQVDGPVGDGDDGPDVDISSEIEAAFNDADEERANATLAKVKDHKEKRAADRPKKMNTGIGEDEVVKAYVKRYGEDLFADNSRDGKNKKLYMRFRKNDHAWNVVYDPEGQRVIHKYPFRHVHARERSIQRVDGHLGALKEAMRKGKVTHWQMDKKRPSVVAIVVVEYRGRKHMLMVHGPADVLLTSVYLGENTKPIKNFNKLERPVDFMDFMRSGIPGFKNLGKFIDELEG